MPRRLSAALSFSGFGQGRMQPEEGDRSTNDKTGAQIGGKCADRQIRVKTVQPQSEAPADQGSGGASKPDSA